MILTSAGTVYSLAMLVPKKLPTICLAIEQSFHAVQAPLMLWSAGTMLEVARALLILRRLS